jgi:lipoprotein-anchoring transpeptidase ErfK/SrfK
VLAATAAAVLVALAAVLLAGAGDDSVGAAPSAEAVQSGPLPAAAADAASDAAAPADAALHNGPLGSGDAASTESTGLAASTVAPATARGKQTPQEGVAASSRTAGQAPRSSATRSARVTAKAPATPVDGTPCTSTAKACVDVADRQAWLISKGVMTRGPVQIMTGDQDDPTPIGTFHVQWKAVQYTSRQYLTQMPYSVFFADGGVAFHEGPQDTYSAGCVKLVHDDAVAFFNYLQVGDEVQVH